MTTENLKAQRDNNRAGLVLFLLFLIWLPAYLLLVRPLANAFLVNYVSAYPAVLHLIPIFGPIFFFGWLIEKRFPSPQNTQHGGSNAE